MSDFQKILNEKLKNAKIETDVQDTSIIEYDILKEIRDEIIETRKMSQMSQKELATKTGIPQANISKIENGNYNPSVLVLQRIATGLGKRLSIKLLDFEEEF